MGEKENNIKKANLHITRKERRTREECPNCNITLEHYMNFCPHCGQENHIKRATVGLLINDFLKDYWTFDSKLFRSLNPLITKPGFLTNEFLKGKRQRYIPPIRLYIFISFIFFLTLSITSSFDKKNNTITSEFTSGFEEGIKLGDNENSFDKKELDTVKTKNNPLKDSSSLAESLTKVDTTMPETDFDQYILEDIEKNPILKEQFKNMDKDSALKIMKNNSFSSNIYKKSFLMQSKEGQEKFNRAFTQKIPILLFILIPVLAFILFLLFYNKQRFYVDYLVFALHLQSFAFLQLLVSDILEVFVVSSWLSLGMFVLFVVYSVVAAKKVFSKTYLGSFFRLLGSSIIYFIAGIIVFVSTLIILMAF